MVLGGVFWLNRRGKMQKKLIRDKEIEKTVFELFKAKPKKWR